MSTKPGATSLHKLQYGEVSIANDLPELSAQRVPRLCDFDPPSEAPCALTARVISRRVPQGTSLGGVYGFLEDCDSPGDFELFFQLFATAAGSPGVSTACLS